MKDATRIDVFFNGDKALFLIPLYQRKYAWKRKHCERLFNDLIKVHDENRYSHFFGSIVSIKADEHEDDLLIIDGQQRITTISLLILAAIQAVHDGIMTCDRGEEYLTDIRNKFLRAKYRKGDRQIKLRPIDKDRIAYDAIMNGDRDSFVPASESGITTNFLLFYDLIRITGRLTFDELIEAIEKLIVIDIRLDSGDQPQLIFESLNSCGKDLEEADKVRNYLLMSLTAAEQEEFYYKYWSKIEACTDDEPTMFIRDFLTVKTKEISNIADLYFTFKSYDEGNIVPRESLLAEMLKYATFYSQALKGKTQYPKVNRKLKQLANLGTTVCMPFYMQFLDYVQEKGLGEKELYTVLDVVENYWARRIICGYPANAMSKTFSVLHSDIMKIVAEHDRRGIPLTVPYSEIMKYILLRKQGNATFPNDASLESDFKTRQIYKIPIDYRYFLFERLENENSNEADDSIVPRMKDGKITIEHIMPQTLTTKWQEALGENWEEIHGTYLHTFANLTLTGYNSQYGNHTFQEKKNGYIDKKGEQVYGFKDSAFRLSNYMKSVDTWTLDEILTRQDILYKKFLGLWPMPSTSYIPLEKEVEVVSFNDDELELTGRSITAFTLRGTRHTVTTWVDALVLISKQLYEEMPIQMNSLALGDFWFHPKELGGCVKIAEGCYVYVACSTRTKMSILNYLFEHLELSHEDLEFELVPIKDKDVLEDNED